MLLPLYKTLEELRTHLGNPVSVTRIPQGECNRLYRLRTESLDLALRINHPEPERLGVNRNAEKQLLETLAGKSWAPRLLEASESWMLTLWQSGAIPQAGERTNLDELIKLLAEVHSTPVAGATLNIVDQIRHLKRWAPAWSPALEEALNLRCDSYRFPERPVLCHHDWHPGNLIEDEGRWILLDWEFGAPGDPAMDLAAACLGFSLSDSQRGELRTAFDITEARLTEALCLMEALAVVWYQANADLIKADSPIPESWYRRWQRAVL